MPQSLNHLEQTFLPQALPPALAVVVTIQAGENHTTYQQNLLKIIMLTLMEQIILMDLLLMALDHQAQELITIPPLPGVQESWDPGVQWSRGPDLHHWIQSQSHQQKLQSSLQLQHRRLSQEEARELQNFVKFPLKLTGVTALVVRIKIVPPIHPLNLAIRFLFLKCPPLDTASKMPLIPDCLTQPLACGTRTI